MKKTTLLLLSGILICLQSCCPFLVDCENSDDDIIIETAFSQYEPILLDRTDFENSVISKNPIPIDISGKIYVQGNLLFINELHKGFHVYDNTDPSNPTAVRFLEIPGSTDLAIRDNIVYINQATDLIAAEYNTSTNDILITKRVDNVFPELRSPDGFLAQGISNESVVVGWKLIN